MKLKRRVVLKSLIASAVGMVGMGFVTKRSAGYDMGGTMNHESVGVVNYQDIPMFSAFTKYGNLVFISGIGCHEGPNTIENHTKVVMRDLKKAIEAAGSSMSKVLQCYAYVDDSANYDAMNYIYDAAWPTGKMPARTCIAVAKSGIPGASLVEIDAICYI